MTELVLVSGSLRKASLNSAAVRVAHRIAEAREDVSGTTLLDIGSIPFYDGDVEDTGIPESVLAAKSTVANADALLVCTPEYNGAPSGVLKNALDWLSRPYGQSALNELPVVTMSASPSPVGGITSQQILRDVLKRAGADLVDQEPLAIAKAEDLRDTDGEFTDSELLSSVEQLVEKLLANARSAD